MRPRCGKLADSADDVAVLSPVACIVELPGVTRPARPVHSVLQVWFYVTWVHWLQPYVGAATTLLFLACSGLLWWAFIRCWRGDPGLMTSTIEEKCKVTGPARRWRVSSGPWSRPEDGAVIAAQM